MTAIGVFLEGWAMDICGIDSARGVGHPHHPLGMKRDATSSRNVLGPSGAAGDGSERRAFEQAEPRARATASERDEASSLR